MRRGFTHRLGLLGIVPLGVLALALTYMLGMDLLEGETRGFWQSLAWASETLTTTGYGHDNEWRHPLMIAFVVTARFAGVFLIFLLFPIFVIPYFESRFEERLPRRVPDGLKDFVLIFRYGPATIVRHLAPDVPIIARVERSEEIERIRLAGADFALSIGQVAGQLLCRQLFGEEFISLEPRMRLAKVSASGLGGHTPSSARVRERTGCSVVAIERGEELFVEFDRDLEIHPGDSVYLCGSERAVGKYFADFPEARSSGASAIRGEPRGTARREKQPG